MEILNPPDYTSASDLFELWKKIRRDLCSLLLVIPDSNFNNNIPGGWSYSEVAEHLYLTQMSVYLVIRKGLQSDPVADIS